MKLAVAALCATSAAAFAPSQVPAAVSTPAYFFAALWVFPPLAAAVLDGLIFVFFSLCPARKTILGLRQMRVFQQKLIEGRIARELGKCSCDNPACPGLVGARLLSLRHRLVSGSGPRARTRRAGCVLLRRRMLTAASQQDDVRRKH